MTTPPDEPSVVIVGGGPAGLMAAETAAVGGAAVSLFEQSRSVGRKLVLAGRSGLNLTNAEPLGDLLDRYGRADSLIRAAVEAHPPAAIEEWSASLGEAAYVGSTGRVFPKSMRATPLLRAWLGRLDALGVVIHVGHRFTGWHGSGAIGFEHERRLLLVESDAVIFALGGGSWPRTGSDAAWTEVFSDVGVDIVSLRASNCGVTVGWTPVFAHRFEGTPMKNVELRCGQVTQRGDPIVTRRGLESGPVYSLIPAVRTELDTSATATVVCDLQPDRGTAALAGHLGDARRPRDSFSTWMRRSGVEPVAVGLLREATGNSPPADPAELALLMKAVPITVEALAPIDRAISTSGGIALHEIDERFMLTDMPGTFVAGEMLDWDAPTGGYLLQACLSTGVAAAMGALSYVSARPNVGET